MTFLTLLTAAALAHPAPEVALDALTPIPGVEHAFQPVRYTPFVGGDRVRVAQTVEGLPVFGATMVVVLDPSGGVRRTVGEPLTTPPPTTTPSVSAADAVARADGAIEGTGALWAPYGDLGLLADGHGGARLVWKVEVSRQEPLESWRVYVDATSGSLIRKEPTLFEAKGRIYETNPDHGDPVVVDLPDVDGELAGAYASARSCEEWDNRSGCTRFAVHAHPDENGDFLFDPDATSFDDPFAEVQMYYHLDRVGRWFDRLGFRHIPRSGQEQMGGVVNLPYANAFFGDVDGDGIPEVAFGQSEVGDFAYDADVVYHEFSHSVYDALVRPVFRSADEYGYDGGPAGLNEGTADLFAIALTGDPEVGEYAGRAFGIDGPVRDLDPDYRCPYDIYGESHEDGKMWGSLGWNLVDDPRLGGDLVAELVLGALAAFPSDATWGDAGDALIATADDMLAAGAITGQQHLAIRVLARQSGMWGCSRVVPLDEGDTSTQWMRGRAGRPSPLYTQFSLDVPEGATGLVFRIDEIVGSQNLGADIYVRRGDHVVHELQSVGNFGFQVPVPVTYDFVVEGAGDGFELVLDGDSDPAIDPGATYYFAVTSRVPEGGQGFASGEITLSGEVLGLPDDGEGIAACGCATTGGGAFAPAWLLLALLPLRRRRTA